MSVGRVTVIVKCPDGGEFGYLRMGRFEQFVEGDTEEILRAVMSEWSETEEGVAYLEENGQSSLMVEDMVEDDLIPVELYFKHGLMPIEFSDHVLILNNTY